MRITITTDAVGVTTLEVDGISHMFGYDDPEIGRIQAFHAAAAALEAEDDAAPDARADAREVPIAYT